MPYFDTILINKQNCSKSYSSVADPDLYGMFLDPPGFGSVSQSPEVRIRIRLRILQTSSKNSKKTSVPDPWHFGSGFGSSDPCFWLMDPDPDPGSGSCYFRHWPSTCQQKKQIFNTVFSAYYFLKVHLHNFSKIKSQKSHKLEGIKVFLTIFVWW